MNKKEVLELKRRLKKDQATFSRLVGCYVDCNHEKVCKFGGKFLTLEEDEYYKYLEISNKVLSGTLGNNLLNLQFPLEEEEVGGRHQILMALRDSELNDETLLDTYYDLVIDTYDEAGNYLILLYLDSYDVMTRTKDNINVDESEEVYKYMLCAICPVTLSKPGLGYLEKEQRIGARIRDWVVGAPETGFLFPAFNDRSTDIHSTLFYTKNTKEPHSEFMTNGLGCGVERTATEQKMAFHSIVRNVLGAEDESTDDKLLDIQQNLSEMADDYAETHDDDDDPFILDSEAMNKVLSDCHVSEEKISRIEKSVNEAFGDKPGENMQILIGQLVNVMKDGKAVRMSKRAGNVVTIDDLTDAIGVDASRYSLARTDYNSPVDIDLNLLSSHSNENPVYYVQYAHARSCNVDRNAAAAGITYEGADVSLLDTTADGEVLAALAQWPALLREAGDLRAPHRVAHYLEDLAATYHKWYNVERVVPMELTDPEARGEQADAIRIAKAPEPARAAARLKLNDAVQTVIAEGLDLLGVTAPDKM